MSVVSAGRAAARSCDWARAAARACAGVAAELRELAARERAAAKRRAWVRWLAEGSVWGLDCARALGASARIAKRM